MRFKHDCDHCIALGEFGDFDLYIHPEQPITVIARRSDEGSDYVSGMELTEFYPELAEAKRRAIDAGLLLTYPNSVRHYAGEVAGLPERDREEFQRLLKDYNTSDYCLEDEGY